MKSARNSNKIFFNIMIAIGIGLGVGYLGQYKDAKETERDDPSLYEVYDTPIWPVSRTVDIDRIGEGISHYLDDNKKDFQRAKEILLDSVIDKYQGQYWLAEMYAKEGITDSVKKYLPQNPVEGIDQTRIEYLKNWIDKNPAE